MALPMFSDYTDPSQEDPRKTKKYLQQSAVSSMASPTVQADKPDQRTQIQQDAIQRRLKRRNLSEDPYQNKPQG